MEEPNYLYILNFLEGKGEEEIFKQKQIANKYDEDIQEYISEIQYSLYKLNFYQSYTEDPLNFISKFLTQHTDLKLFFEREVNEKHNKASRDFVNAQFYKYNKNKVSEIIQEYIMEQDNKAANKNMEKRKRGRKRKQIEPVNEEIKVKEPDSAKGSSNKGESDILYRDKLKKKTKRKHFESDNSGDKGSKDDSKKEVVEEK